MSQSASHKTPWHDQGSESFFSEEEMSKYLKDPECKVEIIDNPKTLIKITSAACLFNVKWPVSEWQAIEVAQVTIQRKNWA